MSPPRASGSQRTSDLPGVNVGCRAHRKRLLVSPFARFVALRATSSRRGGGRTTLPASLDDDENKTQLITYRPECAEREFGPFEWDDLAE
jgi:hypothetical protein